MSHVLPVNSPQPLYTNIGFGKANMQPPALNMGLTVPDLNLSSKLGC